MIDGLSSFIMKLLWLEVLIVLFVLVVDVVLFSVCVGVFRLL